MDKIKNISIELNEYYLNEQIGCKFHVLVNGCVWYADNDINKCKTYINGLIDLYLLSVQ